MILKEKRDEKMEIFSCIKTRRSIRRYSDLPINQVLIDKLIEAGIWAPSGKNGQPWMFKIITSKEIINGISALSIYGNFIKTSPCLILIYLDSKKSYDYIKDVQSCGAAIQNILLCAHSLDIGSCWIGEILTKSYEVGELVGVNSERFKLMAILTIGYKYKTGKEMNPGRNSIESFLL